MLRRVNRAIENMNAYLSMHMDDEEGEKRREHARYDKKNMIAQFKFIDHQRYKEQVFKAPLYDVSVGGMRIGVEFDMKVQLRDKFVFSVLKEGSQKAVLSGKAKVVRIRQTKELKHLGIQFTEVAQK